MRVLSRNLFSTQTNTVSIINIEIQSEWSKLRFLFNDGCLFRNLRVSNKQRKKTRLSYVGYPTDWFFLILQCTSNGPVND